MSHDLHLDCDHCGTELAEFNVTYNYSEHNHKHLTSEGLSFCSLWMAQRRVEVYPYGCCRERSGIRTLYGLKGSETVPLLERAISELGTDVHPVYWEPTEGNARAALVMLLEGAKKYPDAVWYGD